MTRFAAALAAVVFFGASSLVVHAQEPPLVEEVKTIGAPDSPQPVERAFLVSGAGSYDVTLTDLGALRTPAAPLASVRLAVTRGATVVGNPMTGTGTITINAAANTEYVYRVTGTPGTQLGSGVFRVVVRASGGGTVIDDFVGLLAPPSGTPSAGQFVIDQPFAVGADGNYVVSLSDFQFPQTLPTLLLAVVEEGGSLLTNLTGGTSPVSSTLALESVKQYRIFVIAVASSPDAGGAYNFAVTSSGGTDVLRRTIGVAGVTALGSINLAAGNHVLKVTDLAFPVALARSGALVVKNGLVVTQTTATADTPFAAVAGPYDLFGYGEASGAQGGTLTAEITPQGATSPVFGLAQPITPATGGFSSFVFEAGNAAGNLRLRLADYQFPEAFQSLRLGIVQGHALLGNAMTTAGSQDVTTIAAPIHVVVFAQPAALGGLFGVDAAPVGGGATALEITQGVGRSFSARKLSVASAQTYDVTVADVGFPANFTNFAAAVTRGADRVGVIFGSGTFDFAATPGNYFLNFIAQTDATAKAGTYSLEVSERPPAPVITLSSNTARVASGGTVQITWSTTGATACAASGGWTGARAVSGTETSAALSLATTFTLACSGPGGNATKDVTVEINASGGGNGGGGGGGALDPILLVALAMLWIAGAWRGRRPVRT